MEVDIQAKKLQYENEAKARQMELDKIGIVSL
jgi:hypothetical protein